MAVTVTHATQATGSNAGNGEIAKDEWNEAHTVTGLGTMAEEDADDYSTASEVTAEIAAAISDHAAAANPHPTYLTQAEGDALYDPIGRVESEAYGPTWDGDTAHAPSKNDVYDALRSRTTTMPPLVATRWYNPHRNVHGADGQTLTANRIYFCLMEIETDFTASDLGCRVSTAGAGGTFLQLAIYALHGTTGYPTGNPLASIASVSAASATNVTADITGSNVLFPRGFYWGAINSDGAPAIRGPSTSQLAESLIGSTTIANITGAFVGAPLRLFFDHTFGTWPDMTSNSCTEELSRRGGTVFLKAA